MEPNFKVGVHKLNYGGYGGVWRKN